MKIRCPVTKGQEIGEVNIFVGGNMIGTAKLKTTQDAVKNSLQYNIKRIINRWMD